MNKSKLYIHFYHTNRSIINNINNRTANFNQKYDMIWRISSKLKLWLFLLVVVCVFLYIYIFWYSYIHIYIVFFLYLSIYKKQNWWNLGNYCCCSTAWTQTEPGIWFVFNLRNSIIYAYKHLSPFHPKHRKNLHSPLKGKDKCYGTLATSPEL